MDNPTSVNNVFILRVREGHYKGDYRLTIDELKDWAQGNRIQANDQIWSPYTRMWCFAKNMRRFEPVNIANNFKIEFGFDAVFLIKDKRKRESSYVGDFSNGDTKVLIKKFLSSLRIKESRQCCAQLVNGNTRTLIHSQMFHEPNMLPWPFSLLQRYLGWDFLLFEDTKDKRTITKGTYNYPTLHLAIDDFLDGLEESTTIKLL